MTFSESVRYGDEADVRERPVATVQQVHFSYHTNIIQNGVESVFICVC